MTYLLSPLVPGELLASAGDGELVELVDMLSGQVWLVLITCNAEISDANLLFR